MAGIVGYLIGQGQRPRNTVATSQPSISAESEDKKQSSDSLNCPVEVRVGEYKEFFRLATEAPISGKPILVPSPKVLKQGYSFADRKKEILKMIANEDGKIEDGSLGVHESGKFDVDGDGKEEIFITADIYMNHRPHIAMLVKDGKVIFETEGAGVWLEKVYDNKGFTLSEEIERFTGEHKKTRYVYKDGGFAPVWTQKICYIQFSK